jgi:hypothetical protein
VSRRPRRSSNLERAALPAGAAVYAVAIFLALTVPSPWDAIAQGGGMALAIATPITMFFVGWKRRRRALLDSDLRVCLRCLQILTGLPDEGICPECGTEYDIEQVRAAWEHEYPSLRLRHHQQELGE